jgi:hypothetical protein
VGRAAGDADRGDEGDRRALGDGEWLSELGAPYRKNLEVLRLQMHAVVDVVLCVDKNNASDARKSDVFCDGAGFGIFGNERESSSKLIAKEIRSLLAVAPPPTRFVANLSSRGDRRLDAKCRGSVRLVQFGEQLVDVDEFAAICLSDRLEEHAFLFSSDTKWLSVVTENSNGLSFCEGVPFHDDRSVRHSSGGNFHVLILRRHERRSCRVIR